MAHENNRRVFLNREFRTRKGKFSLVDNLHNRWIFITQPDGMIWFVVNLHGNKSKNNIYIRWLKIKR
jgi:hypothetical protein